MSNTALRFPPPPLVYTECLLQLKGNKTYKPVGLLDDYIPQPHAKAPFIVNRACLFQHPYTWPRNCVI